MKAGNFPYAPTAQKKIKSRIKNGRCIPTGKVAMGKKQAETRAEHWKPDERGKWDAYKCPYGKRHYHVGHIHTNEEKEDTHGTN